MPNLREALATIVNSDEYTTSSLPEKPFFVSYYDENKNKKNTNKNHVCFFCNSNDDIEEVLFNRNSFYLCNNCIEKYISQCSRCGKNFSKYRLFDIGNIGKQYCDICLLEKGYEQCHNCKEWKQNCVHIFNNFIYCEDCVSKLNLDIFRCEICEKTYFKDRYGKNNHCITCINSELREVRNYSYKPEPRFFKISSEIENLYLGVELEMGYVDNPNIVNEFVAEYSNNFFYMKKDTSIPIYGCEIVTQPATLKKHLNSKYWKPLLEASKEYGFNANNNKCGIHVHVSKNFFDSEEISMLDCFVNSYDFWKKIARRESHYSEYINKSEDSWGRQTTNRRCALNLSNNETIEFRIFQGTLEYEEVMAYLEACHAASMFVKTFLKYNNFNVYNISDKINKDNITNEFVQFVKKCKYKYLDKYFEKFKVFKVNE